MFDKSYKAVMSSFQVPEQLKNLTRHQMEEALAGRSKTVAVHWQNYINRVVSIAAAICLLFLTSNAFYTTQEKNNVTTNLETFSADISESPAGGTTPENEPKLGASLKASQQGQMNLRKIDTSYSGEGTGIVYATSAAQIESSNNPWTPDAVLTDLPVYYHSVEDGVAGENALTYDTMQVYAENIASDLNVSISQTENVNSNNNLTYSASCSNGLRIHIDNAGTVNVTGFTEKSPLGKSDKITSAESKEKTVKYWFNQYEPVFHFSEPEFTQSVQSDDNGEQVFTVGVYDKAGSVTDQIISYNFKIAKIDTTETGGLTSLTFKVTNANEKLGDYPIITAEKAKDELLSGDYKTTLSNNEPITSDKVKNTELVYWTDDNIEYQQPVYRFFVQLGDSYLNDKQKAKGVLAYGIYDVPAVSSQYLS